MACASTWEQRHSPLPHPPAADRRRLPRQAAACGGGSPAQPAQPFKHGQSEPSPADHHRTLDAAGCPHYFNGYANVHVRAGDGYKGWPGEAPFDRIIVTVGADHIPQPLLDQLKPGGRMVIPLGRGQDSLQLTVVAKDASGRIIRRQLLPVRFVPLTRER